MDIEEDERFRHHNVTVMETGCKKMQDNFSSELKTSSLVKVNNMQIKIKSSTVQGTLIQIIMAYLHVTASATHVLDL